MTTDLLLGQLAAGAPVVVVLTCGSEQNPEQSRLGQSKQRGKNRPDTGKQQRFTLITLKGERSLNYV